MNIWEMLIMEFENNLLKHVVGRGSEQEKGFKQKEDQMQRALLGKEIAQ